MEVITQGTVTVMRKLSNILRNTGQYTLRKFNGWTSALGWYKQFHLHSTSPIFNRAYGKSSLLIQWKNTLNFKMIAVFGTTIFCVRDRHATANVGEDITAESFDYFFNPEFTLRGFKKFQQNLKLSPIKIEKLNTDHHWLLTGKFCCQSESLAHEQFSVIV